MRALAVGFARALDGFYLSRGAVRALAAFLARALNGLNGVPRLGGCAVGALAAFLTRALDGLGRFPSRTEGAVASVAGATDSRGELRVLFLVG